MKVEDEQILRRPIVGNMLQAGHTTGARTSPPGRSFAGHDRVFGDSETFTFLDRFGFAEKQNRFGLRSNNAR